MSQTLFWSHTSLIIVFFFPGHIAGSSVKSLVNDAFKSHHVQVTHLIHCLAFAML